MNFPWIQLVELLCEELGWGDYRSIATVVACQDACVCSHLFSLECQHQHGKLGWPQGWKAQLLICCALFSFREAFHRFYPSTKLD